jgi:hypothetical protein
MWLSQANMHTMASSEAHFRICRIVVVIREGFHGIFSMFWDKP